MGNRLTGKIAVVTGGGRGIGREVALLLAEEGASVVVNDLGCAEDGMGSSKEPADRVVEEIKSSSGRAVAHHGNAAKMSTGEGLVRTALDAFGGLDILVNSVGVLADREISQMTAEDFDRVVESNVKGTFVPTRYAAVQFRQQRSGRIVNMTSDAGLGDPGRSNYAAASEAIIGLTRTVARDLGKYGVTCNAISPSATTRLFPHSLGAQAPAEGTELATLTGPEWWEGPDAPDDPANVAPLAVLLCTDAVPNANGYVFGVHGGSIYLYSNPSIERSIHKWGTFTMEEMDALVPKTIAAGLKGSG